MSTLFESSLSGLQLENLQQNMQVLNITCLNNQFKY